MKKLLLLVAALALPLCGYAIAQQAQAPAACIVNDALQPGVGFEPKFDDIHTAEITKLLDKVANCKPLPFAKDGTVFQNKEGLLPNRDLGFYREYTLIIPQDPPLTNRGAERIIIGGGTELFYTGDHYRHFTSFHIVR